MGKVFAVPSNPEHFEYTKTTLVLDRNPLSTLDSPPRPFDQSTAMLYHPSGHIHPMSLLDLPAELLALVAHHVGVLELRKSVTYLLVVKRWYYTILPVYLFQLPLSDLYLASQHELECYPHQTRYCAV